MYGVEGQRMGSRQITDRMDDKKVIVFTLGSRDGHVLMVIIFISFLTLAVFLLVTRSSLDVTIVAIYILVLRKRAITYEITPAVNYNGSICLFLGIGLRGFLVYDISLRVAIIHMIFQTIFVRGSQVS